MQLNVSQKRYTLLLKLSSQLNILKNIYGKKYFSKPRAATNIYIKFNIDLAISDLPRDIY